MASATFVGDVQGFVALMLVAAIVAGFAYYRPPVALPLVVGLTLRIAAVLFQHYIAPLPDGTADAPKFERVAWSLASSPGTILDNYHYTAAFLYSALMATLYEVTGRSILMLQAISALVGTICIYLTWLMAQRLWDSSKAAYFSAWVVALFPTAILYSALTMRGMFWAALVLVGGLATINWARRGGLIDFARASAFFLLAAAFHPGSLAALVVLVAVLVLRALIRFAADLLDGRLDFLLLAALAGVLAFVLVVSFLDPRIPKFGHFNQLFNAHRYLELMTSRAHGAAAYRDWTVPRTSFDLIWALPLRFFYLLWSPFPWDIREATHLFGVLDAVFYVLLIASIAANSAAIGRSHDARLILFMLIAMIVVFGIGTGNFGTALRHRAKIVFLMTILASPAIVQIGTMCSQWVKRTAKGRIPERRF